MAYHTDIGQDVTCGSRTTRSKQLPVDLRPAHFSCILPHHPVRPCRIRYRPSTSCSKRATDFGVLWRGPFRKALLPHDWMLLDPQHWTERLAQLCRIAVENRRTGETTRLRFCQHFLTKRYAGVYARLLCRVPSDTVPELIAIWKRGMYGTRKGAPYRGPSLVWEQRGPLCFPPRKCGDSRCMRGEGVSER